MPNKTSTTVINQGIIMGKKANINQLAYIGAMPSSKLNPDRDSASWFTPSIYTALAKEVMGSIDLDPFSSKEANKCVNAKRFFTIKDNAFKQEWFQDQGRVFMNPPYTRKIIDAAVAMFLEQLMLKNITQGIVLVNNATETRWFQSLLHHCNAMCLPARRIAFENVDGKHISGNTRGQVFMYFGHQAIKFNAVFSQIGFVVLPYK